jgi:hypothetical protein
MERLFSPCTRLHDIFESRGRLEGFQGHREGLQELNLDVSTEELLSAERAFTYADLCAMLRNADTVAWLTPHAAVARKDGGAIDSWGWLDESCSFRFMVDGEEIYVLGRSQQHLLEICHVVLRLLATSVVHSVIMTYFVNKDLINAPTLAYLMAQCQSLKDLKLEQIALDEDHCRMLGAYSRPDLEIILVRCKLTSAGTCSLAEVLGRNQGPTKLAFCVMDYAVLADGLRGNSRLKSLSPRVSSNRDAANQELLSIASALKENKGLVEFNLLSRCSDETWGTICDSLKTHPTLEVLDLRIRGTSVTAAVLKCRVQAIVDMMRVNMSIHTIHLHSRYREHELFRGSVIPYLEANRLRPRLLAIQKSRPSPYRVKVLGRALLSARTDANSFWMLLSGNAEVPFAPRTTPIAAAEILPTPAAISG